ncbi:MAG: hypothetical protein R2715_03355 [Ilumatobacteraceae bacterium]
MLASGTPLRTSHLTALLRADPVIKAFTVVDRNGTIVADTGELENTTAPMSLDPTKIAASIDLDHARRPVQRRSGPPRVVGRRALLPHGSAR